ncbi:Uncharacterized protein FWK35_00018262 [Aphis craccivora]|uniref:Uncharacterized protein n=1 Tax=Aphis craccivora TaxID=307492 RepID=A0A6G0W1L4_APHCR|nr:Uncharacterized protein FWK35_00018262 [Aphis craccivora]
MCARQMMNIVHFLPLIMGDLIPADEIIEILLSHELSQKSFLITSIQIMFYFLNDNLKLNQHILTHYPSIVLISGQFRHF